MKDTKNKGGRPLSPQELKRVYTVRFNQIERDAILDLGYSLSGGVRKAVAEFIEREQRNAKR